MKAQITAEYMLLAALCLTLIVFSISSLLKIRDAGEKAYRMELFKSSAVEIYNAGEELCAMGSGNSFILKPRESISVSHSGNEVFFENSDLNLSVSKPASCPYSDFSAEPGSEAEIKNDDGTIILN
ncbi:MAG: hypothetical protein WC488_01285 [Candidatus Micrarchaeia archaeon]